MLEVAEQINFPALFLIHVILCLHVYLPPQTYNSQLPD